MIVSVREVMQSQPPPSPQLSATTYTRSHSPVFWSPAPADLQSSHLQKHAAPSLPFTTLNCAWLPDETNLYVHCKKCTVEFTGKKVANKIL